MALRTSAHAVYDLKYHFVWAPKYRRRILSEEVASATREVFGLVAAAHDLEIDSMEVVEDHVHVFLSAPPRHSPSHIVQMLKSISARELFQRFPWLRQRLWGGELWEDGYFVRSVGDEVTADVIRKYIRYQDKSKDLQLTLWDESP